VVAVLSKEDLRKLLEAEPPLIEGYKNVDEQLQPNGFDLTLRQVFLLQSPGRIAVNSNQRRVSEVSPLVFGGTGLLELPAGIYLVTFNEVIHLPKDIMALGKPRSSLLRCGVTINTAVWDAGYSGRSESLLVVYHLHGFSLQKDARLLQLVFFKLTDETEGYRGTYQGENLD
jgi:dUTP pyrophosphatase